MHYETLRVEHVGGASWITLDRPPVNAVTVQLLEELLHAMDMLEKRDQTRCIVLAGAGTKAFCAGADLSGTGSNERFRALGRAVLDRIETHPKPIIGALRGWCIGGGFALAMLRNSSPARWDDAPTPPAAKLSWPGFARASEMRSATEFALNWERTTRMIGTSANKMIGAKSRSVS